MKMASLFSRQAPPSQSQLLRPSATPQVPITHSHTLKHSASKAPVNFRFKKNVLSLQIRERWHAVSASKSNASDGDFVKEKSGGVKTNDAAQGPPILTILAGFVVFFLIFWAIGSILVWLISLIVKFPPSK